MTVRDAVATTATFLLTRLGPDLTPAQETVLRRALAAEAERLMKTAAPAGTGTAAEPTDCEESTGMHTLQSETTPRGRQMAAALALFHMLESGPDEVTEWKVDDLGRLHGHVRRPHSDAQARAAMAAFAEFFGTTVTRSQGRNDHAEWVHLSASGSYRGAPVNVWTHVAIRASATGVSA